MGGGPKMAGLGPGGGQLAQSYKSCIDGDMAEKGKQVVLGLVFLQPLLWW